MILNFFIRLLQILALGILQVLLFNHVHFMGYGTPLVYPALLLYIPLNANRTGTLLWAFVLGTAMDMFANTAGISAASLVLAALIQPGLLNASLPKEYLEDMVPNYRTMGKWNHLRYLTVLLLIHHLAYFALEAFSFFNITDLGISAGASFATSWLIIVLMETLRGKKQQPS